MEELTPQGALNLPGCTTPDISRTLPAEQVTVELSHG